MGINGYTRPVVSIRLHLPQRGDTREVKSARRLRINHGVGHFEDGFRRGHHTDGITVCTIQVHPDPPSQPLSLEFREAIPVGLGIQHHPKGGIITIRTDENSTQAILIHLVLAKRGDVMEIHRLDIDRQGLN